MILAMIFFFFFILRALYFNSRYQWTISTGVVTHILFEKIIFQTFQFVKLYSIRAWNSISLITQLKTHNYYFMICELYDIFIAVTHNSSKYISSVTLDSHAVIFRNLNLITYMIWQKATNVECLFSYRQTIFFFFFFEDCQRNNCTRLCF